MRWDDDLWTAIQVEADLQGITAAEFVKGACWARIGFSLARRGGDLPDRLDRLYIAGQEVARAANDGR